MARGELIQRQWNLLKMLQTRGEGIPLHDLADECGVSERTVQRDFEVLQELGFPIEHEDDEYGKRFWRMPHDFFRTGPLVLSLTEAVSLHLAERLFTPLAGTHFAEGLGTMLDKIRSLSVRAGDGHPWVVELTRLNYGTATANGSPTSSAAWSWSRSTTARTLPTISATISCPRLARSQSS